MFVNAISKVIQFTRPILFISRNYKSETVIPGLATLFFVNDSGCAITCKHVAEQILHSDTINENYKNFTAEVSAARTANPHNYKKEIRLLEKQYGYQNGITVNMKCQFSNVPSPISDLTIHIHPVYDLAIIQFNGFQQLNYEAHNIYLLENEEEIQQGKSLCRLGFPFPEFSNFQYNSAIDNIEWTSAPSQVPCFPIDGIVTRHIGNENGEIFGIELSTPGLRGQSGGPLFDRDGRIFGMQFATHHLHLGFDMEEAPMMINGERKIIHNQPFLHVGQCLHISVIKDFLEHHNIPYRTA